MARKLKKRVRSPAVLMAELLAPWVAMGGSAIALLAAGQSELTVYGVSLAAALGVTVLIHTYENRKRRQRLPPS